jgi:hypothetical protein
VFLNLSTPRGTLFLSLQAVFSQWAPSKIIGHHMG